MACRTDRPLHRGSRTGALEGPSPRQKHHRLSRQRLGRQRRGGRHDIHGWHPPPLPTPRSSHGQSPRNPAVAVGRPPRPHAGLQGFPRVANLRPRANAAWLIYGRVGPGNVPTAFGSEAPAVISSISAQRKPEPSASPLTFARLALPRGDQAVFGPLPSDPAPSATVTPWRLAAGRATGA